MSVGRKIISLFLVLVILFPLLYTPTIVSGVTVSTSSIVAITRTNAVTGRLYLNSGTTLVTPIAGSWVGNQQSTRGGAMVKLGTTLYLLVMNGVTGVVNLYESTDSGATWDFTVGVLGVAAGSMGMDTDGVDTLFIVAYAATTTKSYFYTYIQSTNTLNSLGEFYVGSSFQYLSAPLYNQAQNSFVVFISDGLAMQYKYYDMDTSTLSLAILIQWGTWVYLATSAKNSAGNQFYCAWWENTPIKGITMDSNYVVSAIETVTLDSVYNVNSVWFDLCYGAGNNVGFVYTKNADKAVYFQQRVSGVWGGPGLVKASTSYACGIVYGGNFGTGYNIVAQDFATPTTYFVYSGPAWGNVATIISPGTDIYGCDIYNIQTPISKATLVDPEDDYIFNTSSINIPISWTLPSGEHQSAFQWQIASDTAFTTIVEDSGKITSTVQAGTGTTPIAGVYFIRVKYWDPLDVGSAWAVYHTFFVVDPGINYAFYNPYDQYGNIILTNGTWYFVGRTNYMFEVGLLTSYNESYVAGGIKFMDAANRVYSVWYNSHTEQLTLVSPFDGISAAVVNVTSAGGIVSIYFRIMFNPDISDTINVNPQFRGAGGAMEYDTGWLYSNMTFNIYNLGGLANITASGWAGRLYDNVTLQTYGDQFEIFAADTRTPWLIDKQGFDQNSPVPATIAYSFDPNNIFVITSARTSPDKREVELSDPILQAWSSYMYFSTRYHQQNASDALGDFMRDIWITGHHTYAPDTAGFPYTNTDSSHLAYHSYPNSLRIKDTNTTASSVLYLEKAFRRIMTRGVDLENVTVDFWVMAPRNATGGTIYVTDNPRRQGDTWPFQRRWISLNFAYNATAAAFQFQYESGNVYHPAFNATAGEWYHIIAEIDMVGYSATYNFNNITTITAPTPTNSATRMGWLAVVATNTVNIANDFYIDDIQVYTNWNATYGGICRVDTTFYRLQHWRQDFDLSIEQGVKYTKAAYYGDGWATFGWDMRVNGTWVLNALWCNVTVVDSQIDGTNNWVKYNVTWYQISTKIRTDFIIGLFEGYTGMNEESGLKDLTTFHLDFWFNRMNASTLMGARIITAYYGVSDKSPWYSFWYDNWKATAADQSQSSVFVRVLGIVGEATVPMSVKDVDLVRPFEWIYRSNQYQYHWQIKNIDEQAFRVSMANMEGIDTPAPKKTQMPTVPQNGFGAWLAAAFKGIMSAFGDALTFGAMNVWTSFVGFLDIIAGFFGAPAFFTILFAQVGTFVGFMVTSFLMLTSLVVQMFTFLAYTIGWLMWVVVRWLAYILQILAIIKGIIDGTTTSVTSLGNLWTQFNMEVIITFIILMSPIMWMAKLDEESLKGNDWVAIAVSDIEGLMNIFSMLITFFVSMIQMSIQILFSIIESIPVIE